MAASDFIFLAIRENPLRGVKRACDHRIPSRNVLACEDSDSPLVTMHQRLLLLRRWWVQWVLKAAKHRTIVSIGLNVTVHAVVHRLYQLAVHF